MELLAHIVVQWIRPEAGGSACLPSRGKRLMIRGQEAVHLWMESAWDGQLVDMTPSGSPELWESIWRFHNSQVLGDGWLKAGALVEITSGLQVLGVGKVTQIQTVD